MRKLDKRPQVLETNTPFIFDQIPKTYKSNKESKNLLQKFLKIVA